jgi:enamine deaminase RidA (YjgF/YER057c/UK114 family)
MSGPHHLTRFINPDDLAAPRGYTNGVLMPTGGGAGLLFIAGQVGWDADAQMTGPGLVEQFDRALASLLAVVRDAGGRPESIGKLTIFVTNKQDYLDARKALGVAYRARMGTHYPAMSLVEVRGLVEPCAVVEIEGIAVI